MVSGHSSCNTYAGASPAAGLRDGDNKPLSEIGDTRADDVDPKGKLDHAHPSDAPGVT